MCNNKGLVFLDTSKYCIQRRVKNDHMPILTKHKHTGRHMSHRCAHLLVLVTHQVQAVGQTFPTVAVLAPTEIIILIMTLLGAQNHIIQVIRMMECNIHGYKYIVRLS